MRFLGQGCSRSGQQKPNCQVYEQCRAQGIPLVSLFSHEIQLAIGVAISWPSRVAENMGTRIITKGHLRLVHAGNPGYWRILGWDIRYISRYSSFSQIRDGGWLLNFATFRFAKIHIATVGSKRSPSASANCVLRTHIGVQIAPPRDDNRPERKLVGKRPTPALNRPGPRTCCPTRMAAAPAGPFPVVRSQVLAARTLVPSALAD